jgi:PAS domain S-box-containing protein
MNFYSVLIAVIILIYSIIPLKAEDINSIHSEFLTINHLNLDQILPLALNTSIWLPGLSVFLLIVSIYLFIQLKKYQQKNLILRKKLKSDDPFSDTNLLSSLIDNLPDFIYIKDESSRFILANKKLAQTVGKKSGSELIGKTDHDFYPRHMANEFRKNEIEVMVTDSPILFKEEKGLDENGKEIFVSTSKIPFHDLNGKVIGIVGIGREITDIIRTREELELKNKNLHEINILMEERQEKILQTQEELKVYYEQMLEEKNQLRTLIDNMPDRIYIKDRRSRFVVGNIHISKILKVKSPEDLIGKSDFDLHPKELAEEFYRDEQEIMSSGIALINKEERGRDIEGKEAIISTTKVPVRDEHGNVIGIVGIGRDITRQKQSENQMIEQQDFLKETNVLLEEKQTEIRQQAEELLTQTENLLNTNLKLEKLSHAASKTNNVIIIMDALGNFEWVNQRFTQITGMNLDQFIAAKGRNLRLNSFNQDINHILDDVITTRKPKMYDVQGKDKDGNLTWLHTTISPVLNAEGEISAMIAIDSDITDLKKAENQINKQKQEIENQRDELKKLNATKDKFFSILAHDLKNSFQSITGFSDVITRGFDEIDDDRKKEFLKIIMDSSISASTLLENLLNWARTQTNQIKFEPSLFDLKDIVSQNILMLNVNARNKDISLTEDVSENLSVFADLNMVNTIVRNFLTNAIKFTPIKGKVNITSKIEDDRVLISVTDTGIGMDEETLSKLYMLDEFHNAEGTSGEKGTGLGMIVCKEFALLNGSDISIRSKKNEGSTFTFSLPLSKKN